MSTRKDENVSCEFQDEKTLQKLLMTEMKETTQLGKGLGIEKFLKSGIGGGWDDTIANISTNTNKKWQIFKSGTGGGWDDHPTTGKEPRLWRCSRLWKILLNFWTLKVRTVGWKEAPQEGTLSPTHPGLAFRQVSLVGVSFGFGLLSDISVSFGVKARLNLVSWKGTSTTA